jgi:hypothetical protein
MTITINNPRIAADLQSLAARHGQDVDAYAEKLISAGVQTDSKLQDFFDRMASFGEGKPILAPEALWRGSFYA